MNASAYRRAAQPLLAALLDEVHEPVVALDEHGTILLANAAAAGKLGRAREHLPGKPFVTLLELKNRRGFRRALLDVSIQPVELEASLIGGDREALVLRELPGQRPRSVAVTLGGAMAAQRRPKEAETAAAAAAALDRVFFRFPVGVIGIYLDRRIAFANVQARHLFGTPNLRAGQPFDVPEPFRDIVERLLAIPTAPQSARIELPDGRIVSAIGTGGDRHHPAVLTVEDVTRTRRELQVMQDFLRNAAHQLRTPLTAIATAVEVLRAGAKDRPDERDRFLEHIDEHARRLIRLARGLLVLARAQSGEPMRLDFVLVAPLLRELARQALPAAGVEVIVECDPDVEMLADGDLAHEALAALVENAVEHTRAGTIRLLGSAENGHVTICVVDEGDGILPEHRERIFEPFYRPFASGPGHGLGLAIAAQAVRAMSGELTAEDADVGSRFTIRLPSATKPQ